MDNDIVLLLYRIKVNIRKVEDGNRDFLSDIEADFRELMELIKMFLISERETYYGYFLMNMSFKVDFRTNTIAGIALNEYPPVFCSNPLLYCKFNLKEIIFIMCHEIEHIILNHPAEMLRSNPTGNPDIFMRFNYAADASVNDRILHDIVKHKLKYMSFPNGCIDSKEFANTFDLKNVRENENYKYYLNLIKDSAPPEADTMTGAMQIAAQGDQGNQLEEFDDGIITSGNCGQAKTHQWDCGSDPEAAQEIIKEFVNDTLEMMNQETRGNMPAEFMSQVKLLNDPAKICWEKVLKKYVGTIIAGYRKTRTRLNRRQPERFDLSGKMEDKTLKIVVAIDTSGSVGDAEISRIFKEIFDILSKKKFELTIIECDSKIQRVYRVKTRDEVKTCVHGRGGTYFSPVIEFINKDKYYRDALLIYFTDGYGEYEIPKPRTYRNMWVVLEDEKCLSLKEPYGVVLSM